MASLTFAINDVGVAVRYAVRSLWAMAEPMLPMPTDQQEPKLGPGARLNGHGARAPKPARSTPLVILSATAPLFSGPIPGQTHPNE